MITYGVDPLVCGVVMGSVISRFILGVSWQSVGVVMMLNVAAIELGRFLAGL